VFGQVGISGVIRARFLGLDPGASPAPTTERAGPLMIAAFTNLSATSWGQPRARPRSGHSSGGPAFASRPRSGGRRRPAPTAGGRTPPTPNRDIGRVVVIHEPKGTAARPPQPALPKRDDLPATDRCGQYLQLDCAAWQTSRVGENDPLMSQITSPEQVTPGLRRELIDCWIMVSNTGGAVGFPFLPVDVTHVAPVADKLLASLSPECSRLLIARTGDTLAGWVHLHRNPSPVVAHWGTISHLQSLPSARGQGIGSALMVHARQVARSEMGLEQLRLAVRGGTGLEHFYARLGWMVIGRWPGALRLAPDDDRDETLMILNPL